MGAGRTPHGHRTPPGQAALLSDTELRLKRLAPFAPYSAHIQIAGGGALPGLVTKTLSEVADHAVRIVKSLKAAGVEVAQCVSLQSARPGWCCWRQ